VDIFVVAANAEAQRRIETQTWFDQKFRKLSSKSDAKLLRIYYGCYFYRFPAEKVKWWELFANQPNRGGAGGGNRTHGLGIMSTVGCFDAF